MQFSVIPTWVIISFVFKVNGSATWLSAKERKKDRSFNQEITPRDTCVFLLAVLDFSTSVSYLKCCKIELITKSWGNGCKLVELPCGMQGS